MKKTFFSKLMMGTLFAASILTLTACGDDEEPKVEDKFTTEYTFTAEFSADFVKTADIKAYVLSPEGTVSEEIISKEKNSWVLKGTFIPDKAGVMFEFVPKPNITEGTYKVEYKTSTSVKCIKNGDILSIKSENADHSFTVPAEKLPVFYGTSLILAGEINGDGVSKVTDGSDFDFGLNGTVPRPGGGGGGLWE